MKLPLIQKLEIIPTQVEEIQAIFKKNGVASCPTLLLFTNLNGHKLSVAFEMCQKAFQNLELNPRFPYPTYIVHEAETKQSFFPEIQSQNNLPKHFIKKIKRVKKREQSLLDKVITLSDRIKNHKIHEDLEYLKSKSQQNRELSNLCAEKSFYLELLEKMNSTNPEEV